MESYFSKDASKGNKLSITPDNDNYEQTINQTIMPSSPISLPGSSSLSKFNKQLSVKNNRLLDRLRTQLSSIKSQVFSMSNEHNSSLNPINSCRLEKSLDDSLNSQKQGHQRFTTEPYDSSSYRSDNEMLNTEVRTLRSLTDNQKEQIVLSQKKISDLQQLIVDKDRRLRQVEQQMQQEMRNFKQYQGQQIQDQDRRKRWVTENCSEEVNSEVIYLRKRIQDNNMEMRKFTIQKYEIQKKYENLLKEFERYNNNEQTSLKQSNMYISEFNTKLTRGLQNYKNTPTTDEQEEVESLKDLQIRKLIERNGFIAEELQLQQNTINVLQCQLSKALKDNKRIQTKTQQELKNAKFTYQKLLDSVKDGLSQCYKSEIQDLKNQLYQLTGCSRDSDDDTTTQMDNPPYHSISKLKLSPELSSEIIIVEQDQSLEETDRKHVIETQEHDQYYQQYQQQQQQYYKQQNQKEEFQQNEVQQQINNNAESLRIRVQQLQLVIQHLQRQIQLLKWGKDPTVSPSASKTSSEQRIHSREISVQCVEIVQSKNKSLTQYIQAIQSERDSILYGTLIAQYSRELYDRMTIGFLEEDLCKNESVETIHSQLQYVIQKLKLRNYQLDKCLKQTQTIICRKDKVIQQLRNQLEQAYSNQRNCSKINLQLSMRIEVLEEQNIRLSNTTQIERQRSKTELNVVNTQMNQLTQYKSALQSELSRRQNRIQSLKQQILIIVEGQEVKKRNSDKQIRERRENVVQKQEMQRQLQVQAGYFNKIIKQMQDQITRFKRRQGKQSKDLLGQVKALRTQLLRKNDEIYQIKNATAMSRLRCDSLKTQQEVERTTWKADVKQSEIKLERQIHSLGRQLEQQKKTVQFLSVQIQTLQIEIKQRDQIISRMFSKKIPEYQNLLRRQKAVKDQGVLVEIQGGKTISQSMQILTGFKKLIKSQVSKEFQKLGLGEGSENSN